VKKPVSYGKTPDNRACPNPPPGASRPTFQSNKEAALDLKEIRQIIELMKRNDLSLFHLEREGVKIKLRRGADIDGSSATAQGAPAVPAIVPVVVPGATAALPAPGPPPPVSNGTHILSPMVGTFYRASGPGEKPFVNVGDSVDENTTVCIIEAMKVMNEIKAEKRGIITRVVVEDATPVQFDSPLFEIQPA
jgi:acetyl-CoA carboxylase biotin carboxyl carrier protein